MITFTAIFSFFCSCFYVGFFLLCLFSGHVFYLAFVKFDYGYNMKFNITMGESIMLSRSLT